MLSLLVIIMVSMLGSTPYFPEKISDKDLHCLAKNVYFEARDQVILGQLAIANVSVNRIESEKFPHTVCDVVYQKNTAGVCQFSWTCDNKPDIPFESTEYKTSLAISSLMWYSKSFMPDITKGALFYHADYIEGKWFKTALTKTNTIGNHIFYK